ncbi:MAG: T9SS type A sorting domain-containing protein, partial [Bacteroidetes bacterium]|nr:T9SS type A sorting domain-containing protein [Bacteroidota bacterium]
FSPCLEIPDDEWVWIYPNPNNGEFTLNVLSDGKPSYKIYNNGGQYLMEGRVEKSLNPITSENIDLSKFAQGMYFMRVTRNNEDRLFKIIKL